MTYLDSGAISGAVASINREASRSSNRNSVTSGFVYEVSNSLMEGFIFSFLANNPRNGPKWNCKTNGICGQPSGECAYWQDQPRPNVRILFVFRNEIRCQIRELVRARERSFSLCSYGTHGHDDGILRGESSENVRESMGRLLLRPCHPCQPAGDFKKSTGSGPARRGGVAPSGPERGEQQGPVRRLHHLHQLFSPVWSLGISAFHRCKESSR